MNKIPWSTKEARTAILPPQESTHRGDKGGRNREHDIFRKPCFVCFNIRLEHNNLAELTLLDMRMIPEAVPARLWRTCLTRFRS